MKSGQRECEPSAEMMMSGKKAFVKELDGGREYQRVVDPAETWGVKAGRVRLEAGASCGVHSTGEREEVLVFLSGAGMAYAGDERLTVGQGKVCYIPPNTEHNIVNTGSEPLVYIFCVAPVRPG